MTPIDASSTSRSSVPSVLVRSVSRNDASEIARIYAPSVVGSSISFELEPPTVSEIEGRIAKTTPTYPWLIAEFQNNVVGYAYASQYRERAAYIWSVDVSVYVDQSYHRRGVARALYSELFQLLKLQGFCRAHAGITIPNTQSIKLHESLGFRKIGVYEKVGFKLGHWHDVGWWQLEICPPDSNPKRPIDFSKLQPSYQGRHILLA